jgi:hypothetical protein
LIEIPSPGNCKPPKLGLTLTFLLSCYFLPLQMVCVCLFPNPYKLANRRLGRGIPDPLFANEHIERGLLMRQAREKAAVVIENCGRLQLVAASRPIFARDQSGRTMLNQQRDSILSLPSFARRVRPLKVISNSHTNITNDHSIYLTNDCLRWVNMACCCIADGSA